MILVPLLLALAGEGAPGQAVLVTSIEVSKSAGKAKSTELRIVLRNTGGQPLWVNSRFTLESETCRPPRASVRVVVSDARNRRIPGTCNTNPGAPHKDDYVVLAPGRELTSSVDLFCYRFEKGERIRIDATYWDPADPVPAAPPGVAHLHDRLNARPLTFVAP